LNGKHSHVEIRVDTDGAFDLAWDQVAGRWGLAPAELPEAVNYAYALLCAAEGLLQLIEVRYRPEGERHVFRFTDPALGSHEIFAHRPQGWDEQTELQALEDLCTALKYGWGGQAD